MDDIDELLADALRGINEVAVMHAESMETGEIVRGMRPRIKSILEHQRSALDYLVQQVNATHPPTKKVRKKKAYYPVARKPEHCEGACEANMPGLITNHPAIARAFAAHQPFVPSEQWLGWLMELVNANKHSELTRPQQRTTEIWRGPRGNAVRGITFMREGDPPEAATTDPTGFIDAGGPWVKHDITEWAFVRPNVFVGIALHAIQSGVKMTVEDVRQAAGL